MFYNDTENLDFKQKVEMCHFGKILSANKLSFN